MENQQPSKAALLSVIPGLGQIYNKQKAKGFIFLGVTIVFVLYFLALAAPELHNLITLGDKPGRDNSLFYADSWCLPFNLCSRLCALLFLKY